MLNAQHTEAEIHILKSCFQSQADITSQLVDAAIEWILNTAKQQKSDSEFSQRADVDCQNHIALVTRIGFRRDTMLQTICCAQIRRTGAKCVMSGLHWRMHVLSFVTCEVIVRSKPVSLSTGVKTVHPAALTACVSKAVPAQTSRNQ